MGLDLLGFTSEVLLRLNSSLKEVKECSGTWHNMINRVVLEWSLGMECHEI